MFFSITRFLVRFLPAIALMALYIITAPIGYFAVFLGWLYGLLAYPFVLISSAASNDRTEHDEYTRSLRNPSAYGWDYLPNRLAITWEWLNGRSDTLDPNVYL